VKSLAGFERTAIDAGKTKSVSIDIAPRRLQYWSTAQNKWVTATGARTLHVGASSRDIRQTAEANITQ
jgi:beta-glucosidase